MSHRWNFSLVCSKLSCESTIVLRPKTMLLPRWRCFSLRVRLGSYSGNESKHLIGPFYHVTDNSRAAAIRSWAPESPPIQPDPTFVLIIIPLKIMRDLSFFLRRRPMGSHAWQKATTQIRWQIQYHNRATHPHFIGGYCEDGAIKK